VEGKEVGGNRGGVLIKTYVPGGPHRGILGEWESSLRLAPALLLF